MAPLQFKGVAVKVHPLFILTLAFLAALGRFYDGLLVFGLVVFHELAHMAAARWCGMTPREVHLLPVGGMVRLHGLNTAPPAHEALVSLAGPAFNLLLAVPLLVLSQALPAIGWPSRAAGFSLILALFNLLPALPMDGGRAVRALLSRRFGRGTSTRWLNLVGLALTGGLLGAGTLLLLMRKTNFTLIAVSIYLLAGWRRERNFEVFDWAQEMLAKKRRLEASGKPLKARIYVTGPDTPLVGLLRLCRPTQWCWFRVVDGGSVREFSERDAFETLVHRGYHALAKDACVVRGRTIGPSVERATNL